jgi:hypothetical protein
MRYAVVVVTLCKIKGKMPRQDFSLAEIARDIIPFVRFEVEGSADSNRHSIVSRRTQGDVKNHKKIEDKI